MGIASDLISELPDHLLCIILSYLPIKDAVRSSLISTRWRYLYHQLSKLILSPDLLMGPVIPNPPAIAQMENIISNILLSHSSHLETLDLYATDDWNFTSQNICKWVHCVASKNVKNLSLRHFSTSDPQPHRPDPDPDPDPNHPREILPPSLFLCNRLCRLTLFDCIVSEIPTGFGGFKNLTHCCFGNVEFRDDSLALFLSQCPFLRVLRLESCVVPETITTISGPHIEDLFLRTTNSVEILTVKCPKLICFDFFIDTNDLRVNGILFKELSSDIIELFMDRDGTVTEMALQPIDATNNLWAEKCAEITGTFKSLESLDIYNPSREHKMDIPATMLLQGLPLLERLIIHGAICLNLTKDPAIPTSLESPQLNLRKVKAYVYKIYDEKEIDALVWLLENSPALESMEVSLPRDAGNDEKYKQLLRRVLDSNFRRPSAPARVSLTFSFSG